MALTDDPFYKRLTEGGDTQITVGVMALHSPDARIQFPVFIIDYGQAGDRIETMVANTFGNLKEIRLYVEKGTYTLEIPERETLLLFSGEETAVHTAPIFWGQYTPDLEDHEAFQEAYVRIDLWLLILLTPVTVRQFVINPKGVVVFKNSLPLTPELRKQFRMDD